MTSPFPPPPPGVVGVRLADLDAPPIAPERLAAWLSPEEIARAARFVFAHDRRRYVAGRGLLRGALGAATGQSPEAVRFTTGVNGRPELAAMGTTPGVAFNVSHSGPHLAIALVVARDAPPPALGIDIELLAAIEEMDGVAERVFDDEERAALAAAGDAASAARLATFHRLWTRKEACMKATGAGFTLAPHTFHVDAHAAAQEVALPPHACAPAGLRVTVHDLPGLGACAGAVAVEGAGWRVELVER